ncbi:MAG TPA: hypothetical protein VF628_07115 [Allosphingosinicella sp.]
MISFQSMAGRLPRLSCLARMDDGQRGIALLLADRRQDRDTPVPQRDAGGCPFADLDEMMSGYGDLGGAAGMPAMAAQEHREGRKGTG